MVWHAPARRRAPVPLERRTHIAIADLLRRLARRDVIWTHIPSGEYRTDATAALLKRMGAQPGWPDFIFLDRSGRVAFLELKRCGGKLLPAQQEFKAFCQAYDVRHAVCWSFDEAVAQLQEWGLLRKVRISA